MLLSTKNFYDMDTLFDSFFRGFPYGESRNPYPGLNVWQKEDVILIRAELPGVNESDVEISVIGNTLSITGEKKKEEIKDAEYHRQERYYGKFSRTLTLPFHADAKKVEAHLSNGVLTVTVPRAEEDKPKKISIKTQ